MKKQDWINIGNLFRDLWKYERKTVINGILAVILSAVHPHFYAIVLGTVIDMIYQGAGLEKLLTFAGGALCIQMLIDIAQAYTYEEYAKTKDRPHEFGMMPWNEQALSMDYEHLEDTHVQELRFRTFTKLYNGIATELLYEVILLMEMIMSMMISVGIIFPVFMTRGNATGSFVDSVWFSLLIMGIIVLTSWLTYKSGIFYSQKFKAIYDAYDKPYSKKRYYIDLLSNIEIQKDIRLNHYRKPLVHDAETLFAELKECEQKQGAQTLKRAALQQLASKFSSLLIYLFVGLRAFSGSITIGNVATYASSMVQFTRSMSIFAWTMGNLKMVAQYSADYYEFLNLEKRKYQGTIPIEKRRDDRFQVDFEHVSFRYPGSNQYVIKDLNLSFVIGEKMAIVGKNGSGKTTFIKLLCRLYDVTEGCIKVNGIDIRKYDYDEYCLLFAAVFQDFRIFSFLLGEVIGTSEDADEDRVIRALCKAGLKDRLNALPQGLATYVGKEFHDSGIAFSGGEKQKMAIARAIYKDAPFVIMDEPTAALDPESECAVYSGFDKMVGTKTALYISHRLASCRFCEDILVFDQGTVVQRGSHDELVASEGLYRELWNAQAQYYCVAETSVS